MAEQILKWRILGILEMRLMSARCLHTRLKTIEKILAWVIVGLSAWTIYSLFAANWGEAILFFVLLVASCTASNTAHKGVITLEETHTLGLLVCEWSVAKPLLCEMAEGYLEDL